MSGDGPGRAAPAFGLPAVPRGRRGYIDWLRGLAVLIMIEAHAIDAWTRPDDRDSFGFGRSMTIGGFGAPLFLFLAGVAVALAASARERRLGSPGAAAAAVRRRGWEILGLAFLFRLQAYLLSPGSSLTGLLKVDILNIMGPGIVLTALLWQLGGRSVAGRLVWLVGATCATAMVTPVVRATPLLDPVPDPLEWYLRPSPGWTNFVFFPWGAFVFGGGAVGVVLERAKEPWREFRVNLLIGLGGVTVACAGYYASFLPSIYERSEFWTSSPTFFFVRLGILMAALTASYLWELRPGSHGWSPFQQFGRTSLFIYWIHVEMVYGVMSWPLHRNLSLPAAFAAFVIFTVFLFGLSLLKTWVVERWRTEGWGMFGGAETGSRQIG